MFNDHYSMDEGQQEKLFDIASTLKEGSVIVEIGVCNGKTACVLSYVAQCVGARYFGIDPFFLENTAEGVGGALNALGLPHTLLVGKSSEVPWDGRPIDLLIIDGGHEEACVKPDCERWVPLVASGGYVAFHDWDEPFRQESAHWAIHHYGALSTSGWKHIDYIGGLEIRQKP